MKTKHTPLLLFLTLACVAPAAVSAQILRLPATWGGDRSSRVRFSWSNKDRYSLQQDPSNLAVCLLQRRFPRLGDASPILKQIPSRFSLGLSVFADSPNRESSTCPVDYAFEQYLWQPADDLKHGLGVFASVGAFDTHPISRLSA
jgi:porin